MAKPDPTPVLLAIAEAKMRIRALTGTSTIMQAGACMEELGKIVDAHNAYMAALRAQHAQAVVEEVMEAVWPELKLRDVEPAGRA